MQQKRIFKNYFYSVLYRMLDILIPLVTAPYLSRVLEPGGIGAYSYTNSVASFFILFASAGINIYGQREIAYVQNNKEKVTAVFKEICCLKIALTAVTSAIYCCVTFWNVTYGPLYRILLITVIANGLDISWFFQGMENFKITAIRNSVIRLIGVVLIFVFVKAPEDLLLYTLLCSVPILLGNLSLWIQLKGYLCHQKLDWKRLKTHFRPIFALFIPQIAIEVYTVLDKTMLGTLIPSIEEVAYYEQSQKIVKVGIRFLTAFGGIMLSRASNAFAEEGERGLKQSVSFSFRFTFFLGIPIMLGVAGISGTLVPWFFGPGYEPVSRLILIASPLVMCIGFSNIIGLQYLLPANQQKVYSISVIAGALANIVLNFLLIPRWAALGASIASVFAEGIVAVIQVCFTFKALPYAKYIKAGLKNILAGLVMLCIVLLVGNVMSGPIGTGVQIAAGVLTYFFALLCMKDQFVIHMIKKGFSSVLRRHI